MSKPKIIAIIGPTSVGKSDMAIKFAKKLDTEIISADSMQIYKEFNILSAKPSKETLKIVKHHFIDCISVSESFNVSIFLDKAKEIIKYLNSKNKIAIVTGGTGFYVDALLKNYKFHPVDNDENFHLNQDTYLDSEKLYEKLLELDPETSGKIHPSDKKRILRAINFYNKFGKSINTQVTETLNGKSLYDTLKIGLNFNKRSDLYEKINNRVDNMLKRGLVNEVEFISKNFMLSKTAKEAIGYKEIFKYISGNLKFEDSVELLKRNTRRYAKRQITWFKRDKEIFWYNK